MTQEPIEITIGYDVAENPITYKYTPYDSRGIAVSAATRSGKSTLLFQMKRDFKEKVPEMQLVSIARDRDEFRQRDEIPFIIIGNQGEIPIDPKLARQLGENVRKVHCDVIVDINSLQTEKEQDEFVSQFIRGLQTDNDERFWSKPCGLFIDEIQILCKSGSTNFPKSRDAIVVLAQTCLKKNILPIVASHKMKDFYVNARDEITNHLVGYLDNIDQQEFACELLKLPYTMSKKIDEFGNTKGRFFVRGFDIIKTATEIQVKPSKIYAKGEIIIPKLGLEARVQASALRESLKIEDEVSVETRLRIENTRLQSRNDDLSETQMTEANIVKFRGEGFKIGYNKSTEDAATEIEASRPTGLAGLVKHGIHYEVKQEGWRKKLVIL